MRKKKVVSLIQAIIFMLPAAVLLIIFVYGPLVSSIGYSFTKFENFKPVDFVGLKNFRTAFEDKLFWNSIVLTFKWVILNTLLPTLVGLCLAILLEFFTKRRIFTNVSRTVLFMPMMMSLVSVGLLWALIYDSNIGIIPGVLKMLGYTGKFNVFAKANHALYVAFIPVIWQSAGFSMVIFSAAAQGISRDIIEASLVEGATKMQQVKYVMFPAMMNTIIMVMMINMISGFKAFDLLYTLTKGGPGSSTNITAIYSYNQAFASFRFDYSSAIMVLLLVCVIVFLLLFSLITKPIKKKYSA